MEAKNLFNNFDLLADAPNGVAKLRELILQLAVQGKLVKQDPNDEPASVLLEKITKEKERLITEKKLKETGPLPQIVKDEMLYDLPKGWAWKRFGDIANITTGNKDVNEGDPKGQYPFFTCAAEPLHSASFSFEGESLIMPGNGANVGLVILYNGRFELYQRTYVAQELKIDAKYLLKYFQAYWRSQLKGKQYGSAMNYIKIGNVNNFVIAVPPLTEQRRIVAKVDELIVLCNELEEQKKKKQEMHTALNESELAHLLEAKDAKEFTVHWQRICDHFEMLYDAPESVSKLRSAILQLAVHGMLVKQDPKDEPATVLLEKIREEKERLIAEKKIKKSEPLPPIKEDEIPYELPEGWVWTRLGNIANNIQDGTHFSPKGQYVERSKGRYLYITSKNIKDDGVVIDNATFVDKEIHDSIYTRCNPELGDLLLIKDGAITGRVTINNITEPFSMLSSVSLIKTNKNLNENKYLMFYLRSPIGQEFVVGRMSGSAIPRIILDKIRKTIIALPPLNEQSRIVSKVNELMSFCNELEKKLTQAESASEILVTAVVREMVEG